MTRYTQNKKFERVNSGSNLRYAYKNSESFFSGTVRSCRNEEMCFESGYEIKPGVDIYFEIGNAGDHDTSHRFGAKVIWCKPLPNNDAFFYMVGVKIHDPPPYQN